MTSTTSARAAALGALLLAGTAAGAYAAPAHHKAKAPPAPPAATADEVATLRAQITALTQRLDAAEANLQQTRAAADKAKADTEVVASKVADSQRQLASTEKALPGQIKAAVTKAQAPSAWAANTQVGGIVFADISTIDQKTNGAKAPISGTGLDIKRVYFSVDHRFNEVWTANFTTDARYNFADKSASTAPGAGSNVNDVQLFVKKAYLQAKLSDALVVSGGSNSLPWAPYSESLYGLRFIEKTLIDRTGYGVTTDWGAHASGKLLDGLVAYQVSVVNGGGFHNASRSGGMDVETRVNASWQGFNLAVGTYEGELGKEQQNANAKHTATRFDAVAAYVQPAFRVGAEYFTAHDWTQVTAVPADKAEGYSFFGTVVLFPGYSAFARYDQVKPNQTTAPAKKDIYYNFGLDWAVDKQIDIALVYKREKVEGGLFTGGNGAIGATTGAKNGSQDELGVYTQYKY